MDNAHKLKAWLKREGRKVSWLADTLAIQPGAVSRWLGGHHIPQPGHRARIEEITGGAVCADDWEHEK